MIAPRNVLAQSSRPPFEHETDRGRAVDHSVVGRSHVARRDNVDVSHFIYRRRGFDRERRRSRRAGIGTIELWFPNREARALGGGGARHIFILYIALSLGTAAGEDKNIIHVQNFLLIIELHWVM
ncbi:uncharacterized protein LOC112688316 [Sipha flava]|uniref:Uncharacterized protein LOC112688316 n=1 Tax=Sipha flava TaxID=143950 RepID=A0A8B8G3S6_9HEMI|nr:uncharacterized protein LOC112688316 [Sipha flava]